MLLHMSTMHTHPEPEAIVVEAQEADSAEFPKSDVAIAREVEALGWQGKAPSS